MYGRGCLGRGLPHWGGRGAVGSAGGPPFASWGRVGDGFCIGVWKSWFWNIYLSGDPPVPAVCWVEKSPSPPEQPSPPNLGVLVGSGLPSLVSWVLGAPCHGWICRGWAGLGLALLHPPVGLVGFTHG